MAAVLEAQVLFPPRPARPARRPGRRTAPPVVLPGGVRAPAGPVPIAVVLAVAAVVVALGLVGLRAIQGSPPAASWPELAARSTADAAPVAAPGDLVLTVAPGDTLWDIATRLAPGQDPRPIVHTLTEVNGGTLLQVGQTLVVPAELIGG